MNAFALHRLNSESFRNHDGTRVLCFDNLPVADIDIAKNEDNTAILSWRRDLNLGTNSARNVYITCQEAKARGFRYMCLV